MPESTRDHLDEALDEALSTYCQPPGQIGLERRVLASVNEAATRPRPINALAAALAAAAAMAFLLLWGHTTPQVEPERSTNRSTLVNETRTRSLERASKIVPPAALHLGIVRKARSRRPDPKLPQFPTPTSPSGEERALLRLASLDTKDLPKDWPHLGSPIEPIKVPALEIKPLE